MAGSSPAGGVDVVEGSPRWSDVDHVGVRPHQDRDRGGFQNRQGERQAIVTDSIMRVKGHLGRGLLEALLTHEKRVPHGWARIVCRI